MKLLTTGLLLALLAANALPTRAQEHRYAVIEYMHIPETQSDDAYLATEKLWQRLHQKAVDAGICRAWYLERVENGGRGDFATIRIYDSLEKMRNPWPEAIQKDLFNAEETKTMSHTEETRDLIRRELWEIEASAVPDSGGDPSTYVSLQFMKAKPGRDSEYFKMEKETYTKIHMARVKTGEMKNWHFLSRMFPSGTDSDADYVTINVYPTKEMRWNSQIVETALGKDAAARLADPTTIRTMVRSELWRPILGTKAPAKKS